MNRFLGISYLILYGLLTASSTLFISETEKNLPVIYVAFYSILFSALIFAVLNLKNIKTVTTLVKNNFKTVLLINVTTAIVWLATFIVLGYFSPYIVVSITFSVLPLTTILLTRKKYTNKKVYWIDMGLALAILAILFAILIDDFAHHILHAPKFILYIGIGSLVGIFLAVNNLLAKRLASSGFTASMVMSVRFYILLIASLIILLCQGTALTISLHILPVMFFIALASVALPLFFLQCGIEKVPPSTVAFVLPFIPFATYLLNIFVPGFQYTWWELFLVMLLGVFILISVWYQRNNAN